MEFQTFGLNNPIELNSPEDLGGKGAGLVWMTKNGFPVPPGFVIPTKYWELYHLDPANTLLGIAALLPKYLAKLEAHFGYKPLLSVRSGARVSCPGMMDTILNVGIDAATLPFWKKKLGDAAFEDSFHRLITMYGSVVKGLDRKELESAPSSEVKKVYEELTGEEFPDAAHQLLWAIEAVFKSWDNERAKVYRKLNNIPEEWGTAVTVQAMVFGNLNDKSATGVLFTRNPNTGEPNLTGEFLVNAQGEDVVAGTHTPKPIEEMDVWNTDAYCKLAEYAVKLENLKQDVQDVEFTIQDGEVYLLQTRNAKRTGVAALKIALDLLGEGKIDRITALRRVKASDFDRAQLDSIDPSFTNEPDFVGSPACSGVVCGKVVFTSQAAIDCKEPCILVTDETSPDDIAGMSASVGIVTMKGGTTSHAAVVARSLNKPCITGVGVDYTFFSNINKLTIDGGKGHIWIGEAPIIAGQHNGMIKAFKKLLYEHLNALPVITDVPDDELKEALFDASASISSPEELAAKIDQVANKVKKLFVEVKPTPAASAFRRLIAPEKKEYKDAVKKLVKAPNVTILDEDIVIYDLASLVLAKGDVEVAILDSPKHNEAAKQILKWNKGITPVSFGKFVPEVKCFIALPEALQAVSKQ